MTAGIRAFIHAFSLPKGPFRKMFTKFGFGFALFGLMAINWVMEDMYALGDTMSDVLFALALIISLWGFFSSFSLKLNVRSTQ